MMYVHVHVHVYMYEGLAAEHMYMSVQWSLPSLPPSSPAPSSPSEVLSDLLTDVQPTPQLPFMLPLPADSAHPQHRAAVEVTLNSPTAYGMRTGSGTVTYINKGVCVCLSVCAALTAHPRPQVSRMR